MSGQPDNLDTQATKEMDNERRRYVAEAVLEEESCATCKYWRGRWRGEIDGRSIKEWTDRIRNDTYSFSSDGGQFTYGECHRLPPTQSAIEKVRNYGGQVRWERWLEMLEKQDEDRESRIREAEEEIREAEKVAADHPELWERQMAEAKVAKLEKEVKKLERQPENSSYTTQEQRLAMLDRMAPEESVRTGRWTKTTNHDWCGEYKRDKDKSETLIKNLCGEKDWYEL